jgi:histone H3/H4
MATQTEKEMRIKSNASEMLFKIGSDVAKAIKERAFEIAKLDGREVVEKEDVYRAKEDIIRKWAGQLNEIGRTNGNRE